MARPRKVSKSTPNGDPQALLIQITEARRQFNEAVTAPLELAMRLRDRNGLKSAQIITELPLNLASHGFTVSACHASSGWRINVSREIGGEMIALGSGQAKGLYPCMVQLTDGVLLKLALLERSLYRDTKEVAA